MKLKKQFFFMMLSNILALGVCFLVFFWGLGVGCCFEEVYIRVM
jgi:hypothetical protein